MIFAASGDDVRLVNRLATGVAAPTAKAPRTVRVRRGVLYRPPLVVMLWVAALAVGAAMMRVALTGPAGIFWWLGIVLAFFAGHRWERARARQREHELAAELHRRFDRRLHQIEQAGRG